MNIVSYKYEVVSTVNKYIYIYTYVYIYTTNPFLNYFIAAHCDLICIVLLLITNKGRRSKALF